MSGRNSAISNFTDLPPAYNEKLAVEVCSPQHPYPIFEPAERQRHFGILQYRMNRRFRMIMIVLTLNILLVAALLTVFLMEVFHKGHYTGTTVTTVSPSITTKVLPSSLSTTLKKQESTTVGHELCDPTTPTTLVIAYSNDFSADFTANLYEMLPGYANTNYAMLGSIKFDTMNKEDFVFEKEWTDLGDAIKDDVPDPSLGFGSNDTGSDVLNMIERFLAVKTVPICGSMLRIYMKRYPNEVDISDLVSKIRQYHITLTFMVSDDSAGGSHPETLYDLATQTNGFCVFSSDDQLVWVVGTPVLDRVYLAYAANPDVSGNQVVSLPQMNLPCKCRNWFSVTVQDSDSLNLLDAALYEWGTSYKLGIQNAVSYGSGSGNFRESSFTLDNTVYNITLTCKFKDTKSRRLQVRVYLYTPVDYWVPYDN